jgi:signal transduction histidine kinase
MRRKRYLVLIMILIVVLGISLTWSIVNSRRTMMDLIIEEGRSFLLMVSSVQENSIFAEGTYEDAIIDQLIDICEYIDGSNITSNRLREIKETFNLESITVSDVHTGKTIVTSGTPLKTPVAAFEGEERIAFDYFMIGSRRFMEFKMKTQDRVYSIQITAEEILRFRQEFGINKVISHIVANPLVTYLVLQDEKGIIIATPNVSTISRIEDDEALINAIDQKSPGSRVIEFEEEHVLELIQPFIVDNQVIGVFRMGMDMSSYHRHVRSTERQLILLFVIILVVGFGIVFLFMKYESYIGLKDLFDKTLSAIEDAFLKVERNGLISGVNKMFCTLTSYDESVLLGSDYFRLFDDDPFDVRKVVENSTKIVNEKILFGRSIQYASYPLVDKSNRISGIIAVLRDVTVIREFEKDREESERLKFLGNLVANFAHEIKNPLNGLSIAAQRLIREYALKDDEYKKLINTIKKGIDSLNRILNDFLSIARPRIKEKIEFDGTQVLRDVINVVDEQLKQYRIALKKNITKDVKLIGNEEDFKRALLNIMLNAIDAVKDITERPPEISIALVYQDDSVIVKIHDNGRGMDANESERIFTPYYTTKTKGTGLGLYIAQKIIKEHDAQISVDSIKGEGTMFTIIFRRSPSIAHIKNLDNELSSST